MSISWVFLERVWILPSCPPISKGCATSTSVHVRQPIQPCPLAAECLFRPKTVFRKPPFLRGQIIKWGHKLNFQDMVIPDKRSEQRGQEEDGKAHAFQVQKISQNDQLWKSCNYLSRILHTFSKWWNSWSHGDLRISLSNSFSMLHTPCWFLQEIKILPLGSNAAGWNLLDSEGKGYRSYLSWHSYLSYPGLTEHSTIHLNGVSVCGF